ncbi:hypothetical protein SADO_04300 [Salinisphaera dokdonensis CL-ES53]|uniref:Uncharacterized protein n=1 Tax=Salinisphaera dokdonensis CL-ES53 TaxID=1304272 RepID=A0ABV2AZ80_9GAMM
MADLEKLSKSNDTSIEILQAIADQRGDEEDAILEALENPEDFDAIVTRAREHAQESGAALRWQGREIL